MRKKSYSSYEITQVNKLIHEMYELYGRGLDFDECWSESWVAYAETRHELVDICNNGMLWVLARRKIKEALEQKRKIRNEKIHLESRLSLNMIPKDSDEPVYSFLPTAHGDFVNGLCLWMYGEDLGLQKSSILRYLYHGEDDLDIIKKLRLENEDYFELKRQLREDMRFYEEC